MGEQEKKKKVSIKSGWKMRNKKLLGADGIRQFFIHKMKYVFGSSHGKPHESGGKIICFARINGILCFGKI